MRFRFPMEFVGWWGVSRSSWVVVELWSGCWRQRRRVGGSWFVGWMMVVSVSDVVGEGHSSVLEPSDSVDTAPSFGAGALMDVRFRFFIVIGMGSPAHMRCLVNAASR